MEFFQDNEPDLEKPIIIAAMQDMGNVGAIVIEHINENLGTKKFRIARSSYPTFVLDMGGHIKLPDDKWEYRHTKDMIIFGGGAGQPQATTELHAICQDVIDIAKKYSAKYLYGWRISHHARVWQVSKNICNYNINVAYKADRKNGSKHNTAKINNHGI